jgi:hypothetical protein
MRSGNGARPERARPGRCNVRTTRGPRKTRRPSSIQSRERLRKPGPLAIRSLLRPERARLGRCNVRTTRGLGKTRRLSSIQSRERLRKPGPLAYRSLLRPRRARSGPVQTCHSLLFPFCSFVVMNPKRLPKTALQSGRPPTGRWQACVVAATDPGGHRAWFPGLA